MPRLPVVSLGLLSMTALAYELLLMRLFSIIHWHHYAYMIIGLALLGHAVSGSVVLVLQDKLLPCFKTSYLFCILFFSLFALVSFQCAQSIPFNAEEILWDWRQSIYLMVIFLLLSIPFFFVGSAICLVFRHFKQGLSSLYAADLIGAGIGCLVFILIISSTLPDKALIYILWFGIMAALVAIMELHINKSFCLAVVLAIGFLQWQQVGLHLNISPYKSLSQTKLIKGTREVAVKSSPLGMINVLASDRIPFRYVPGMSFQAATEPLPQLALFTDADNMSVITQKPDRLEQVSYLDQVTSALPFHLRKIENQLIIGSGGGNDVLQARYHKVSKIDAVELNPQIIDLTTLHEGDFVSDVYRASDVDIHIDDVRGYLNISRKNFDLIQLTLLDSFTASAAGLYALNESYLYTIEALQLYLSHLRPNGFLSITRWVKMPPRDSLKIFNTASTVLKNSSDPGKHMIMIRSWQTATLLVKNGEFNETEIKAAEQFCLQRNFDLVYTPKIKRSQVNHFNRLPEPVFYQMTQAMINQDKAGLLEQYKFNLKPATDDTPYFQHFFRWSTLPELLRLVHKGGASLIESGYLVILSALFIAIFSSIILIFAPLKFLPKSGRNKRNEVIIRWHILGYFFAIGIGFLMLEIAFMQKFVLYLHHPVYASSATLTAFLVFAGLGSLYSGLCEARIGRSSTVGFAISGIVIISLSYLVILPFVFTWGIGFDLTIRFIFTISLIAPLAFCMGMPLPLAMSSLASNNESMIPWAWAINGCASVISSVLAALLAMQFGFMVVIVLAVAIYFGAVMIFPKPDMVRNH